MLPIASILGSLASQTFGVAPLYVAFGLAMVLVGAVIFWAVLASRPVAVSRASSAIAGGVLSVSVSGIGVAGWQLPAPYDSGVPLVPVIVAAVVAAVAGLWVTQHRR
jgi:hypothetical protein